MNDIYLNNKYTKLYYNIVDRAKQRILNSDIYTEKHHIIPECFFINRKRKGAPGWLIGDPDDINNIVQLTAKEHYLCHVLLTKMTVGKAKSKMCNALWRFVSGKSQIIKRHCKVTSRIYETVKIQISKDAAIRAHATHSGMKRSEITKKKISNANKGKKRTPEQNAANSERQLASNYQHNQQTIEKIRQASVGREVSVTTREKISNALTGRKGKPWSVETREKMKKRIPWNKGKTGFNHNEETRRKIGEASRLRQLKTIKVDPST